MTDTPSIYSARVEWLGANYDNASRKSDKFYEIVVTATANGRFIEKRRWGKYGATGQTKIINHYSEWDALQSARKQIESKVKKGYTKPVAPLTRLATAMED